ncbi:glycine--tRNA ligase, partial [archaeon]|nr:glycine--tRNA ligase [archaeon]
MHTTKELAMFLKKKGFIYQSSEIYGGVAGLYDYGHLGTRLKKNFENVWRNYFLELNDNFHEIETAQIMHKDVFKGSGHLENFADPVLYCSKCDFSERADHFVEKVVGKRVEELSTGELNDLITKEGAVCPQCKAGFKPIEEMNMMFPLDMGVGGGQIAYLRPETAQSPYVNFKLQYEMLRKKLPLGLALIGRAFRNEISPRNLTLRQREFTQAELQIFFNPTLIEKHPDFESVKEYKLRVMLCDDRDEGHVKERTAAELVEQLLPQFYVYHLVKIQQFYLDVLGVSADKFRLYQLNENEKAFYNKFHFDLEVEMAEHGWVEVGGLHYRTDHDLKGHQTVSKEKMEVYDEETATKFIPHVLELSFGVDRNVYGLLDLNYEDHERGNVVLHLPSSVVPFTCAVFPLVKNKPGLVETARDVYNALRKEFSCLYDQAS